MTIRHFIKPRLIKNITSSDKGSDVVPLLPSHGETEYTYTESWLQNLIHNNPDLLPVSAFEASFETLIPIARELPTSVGPLDNLFVTPDGDLVLVECKLWRNPEARRKVIAQIIDYAAAISEWSYQDLMDSLNRKNNTNVENPLYDLAKDHPDILEESLFVDNISRNLRLGRHLLLVVGDGIREDIERMTNFLQQRTGLHFTLGLLEMGIYKIPDDNNILVIPNILLKTTLIERGVITINNSTIKIESPSSLSPQSPLPRSQPRSEDLTEIKFFEALESRDSASAAWLKDRLNDMKNLGMTWDIKKSLLPRYSPDGETEFNFGYFKKDGKFITHNATWFMEEKGLLPLAEEYIRNISAIVPSSHIEKKSDGGLKVYVGESILTISDLIGKEHDFMKVISNYILSLQKAIEK